MWCSLVLVGLTERLWWYCWSRRPGPVAVRRRRSRPRAAERSGRGPARPAGLEEDDEDDRQAEEEAAPASPAASPPGSPTNGQRVGVLLEDQRQRADEDRAEDRAADRAEPAEHDHREEEDRQLEAEGLRRDAADGQRVQHARQPGVHRADQEDARLVALDVDAHDRGRDLAVAQGLQRPARHGCAAGSARTRYAASARTSPRYQSRSASRKGTPRTKSSGSRLPKVKPNSENSGAERPLKPPVTERPGVEHVLADEDQAERGDAEVDAAQPGRDRAEQQAGEAGQQHAHDHADAAAASPSPLEVRDADAAGLPGDVDVGDRADGEEEGVREGQLAGRPDQQVQPDGADDRRAHGEAGAQPELLDVERQHEQHDAAGRPRAASGSHVRPAGARRAARGRRGSRPGGGRWSPQTRVSSFVPNSPDGRTSSTAIITTYGTTSPKPRPRNSSWSW